MGSECAITHNDYIRFLYGDFFYDFLYYWVGNPCGIKTDWKVTVFNMRYSFYIFALLFLIPTFAHAQVAPEYSVNTSGYEATILINYDTDWVAQGSTYICIRAYLEGDTEVLSTTDIRLNAGIENITKTITLPFRPITINYLGLKLSEDSDCSNGTVVDVAEFISISALPIVSNGITALRESTEAGFQNTTGETVGGAVVWAGDSFIKVIIGSALGVLLALRYWIVALTIIFLIVFFYKRARL